MLVMISHLPSTIERPCGVHNVCGGPLSCTAMNCIVLFLNWVLHGQSFQYILVYNFTNLRTMSHSFDVFACSSRVNIEQLTLWITITLLSAVSGVRLRRFLIPTTMLYNPSSNTSLLEVMIAANNQRVLIADLSDWTIQIISDAWWASMNLCSKWPIGLNNSNNTSSWPC